MIKSIDIIFDKSDMRTMKIIKNIIYSIGIKGFSIIVGLLLLPVYVKYFSDESVIGMWLTLISMLSWIFTFDLGIGNGLRNRLTAALSNFDYIKARTLISTAYASSVIFCILVTIILHFILKCISLNLIFNIHSEIIPESILQLSIHILIIGVMLQFVLKLINSILLAMHMAAIPSALTLSANVIILVYMLLAPIRTIEQNLLSLSTIYTLATNIPLFFASFIVFNGKLNRCSPSVKMIRINEAVDIMKLGLGFLWLQTMSLIINNTNNFLISAFVGSNKVVYFQTYYKIFSLISTFFVIGLTPIWSSVTDAMEKKDFYWIESIRKRLYNYIGFAIIFEIILILFAKGIISLWMGPEYATLNIMSTTLVALLDIITIWSGINANIAGGLSKLKNSFIFLTFGAFINIPLSFVLSNLISSWIAIVIANIISLLPYCISETISTTKFIKNKKCEVQISESN